MEDRMKPDTPIEPEVLSVEDFCAFADVGKTMVYKLIAAGTLKTRRLGRRRLILLADAREFLQSLPTE
jgi:excisionase family DNA binding protein